MNDELPLDNLDTLGLRPLPIGDPLAMLTAAERLQETVREMGTIIERQRKMMKEWRGTIEYLGRKLEERNETISALEAVVNDLRHRLELPESVSELLDIERAMQALAGESDASGRTA